MDLRFRNHHGNSVADTYKAGHLIKEGWMTPRQGYPCIELDGNPLRQREDLPAWRSADGSWHGPTYLDPRNPHNTNPHRFKYHQDLARSCHHDRGKGYWKLTPKDQDTILAHVEGFHNGAYYPVKQNRNIWYEELPWDTWIQEWPEFFYVKADELRKWLHGRRTG